MIGDHDAHRRRRMIGEQQHREAVGIEPVFGNSLFRANVREAIWNFRVSSQARQRYATDQPRAAIGTENNAVS